MIRQHFLGPTLLSGLGLALAALYGWHDGGTIGAVLDALWIATVLAVLEVSLSFDNAVVNASVLAGMDAVWRRRFLTWGMAFAVFGTRVVFPLAIVGFTAGLGPVEALRLSLEEPERYETIVGGAHLAIAGFGGAFLAMVGLAFFVDGDKLTHWLPGIERWLAALAELKAAEIGLLLLVLAAIAGGLPPAQGLTFLTAGLLGIVAFVAVSSLGAFLEAREARRAAIGAVARSGLGAFLYLNLLDASFSFDGVVGAFALTNNMVVIAIGLSIGAVFVRAMTLLLVAKGTLGEYPYLEHGAFWAILALGAIMLASALVHIPEWVTGLAGAVLIGAAVWSSVRRADRTA